MNMLIHLYVYLYTLIIIPNIPSADIIIPEILYPFLLKLWGRVVYIHLAISHLFTYVRLIALLPPKSSPP